MLRISRWMGFVVVGGLLAVGVARAEAVRPAAKLLPKNTVGFISTANWDNFVAQWKKTQYGKLMADPVMKPFEEDMRRKMQERWASITERVGLKVDDLKGLPSGEAALAMIQPAPGEVANVLLIDVTGRTARAKEVLANARANMLKQNASESRATVEGVMLLSYTLPASKNEQTVYFLTQNLFGAADNLAVAQGILGRLAGTASDSLADVVAYQQVMKRCQADEPAATPQIRWFIYPLGYAEAARAATPKEQRRKGKTIIEIMRNQGFGAVQGVGGHVDLSAEGYELVYRTAVYAPLPYKKSMNMLSFPNHADADFAPQPWVSRDIATYLTAYVDILNAFDNFAPFYDEMVGEEGVWAETLRGMKEDPNGPQIDLREELIKNLGQRITMVTDYKLPITTTSERLLFAIEVKDEKAVAKAIEKSLKNDPSAKKREVEGRVVWEIVEEEQPKVPSLNLEIPSLTPPKGGATGPKEEKEEEQEKEARLLPHGAITVAHGYLLIASHLDFLVKVLKPVEPSKALKNNLEFQQVWSLAAAKFGMKTSSGRQFSWTDEELRPTYELIRQGKMPESESLLGRLLNTLAGSAKKGTVRQQRISGKNLPDYQVVRRYLGTGTAASASEPNGWFIKGVLLKR